MRHLFPIPPRDPGLPPDLDLELALRLLKRARDILVVRGDGYLCNALMDVIQESSNTLLDMPTLDQLHRLIQERLKGESTYTSWLLEHHNKEYWKHGGVPVNREEREKRDELTHASRLAWVEDLINEVKEKQS